MKLGRDWSHLFPDLISLVVSDLSMIDRANFGCVCKNWHNASKSIKPKPSSPWLIYKGFEETTTHLFPMTDNIRSKVYNLRVPEPAATRTRQYIGFSHGWLITLDIENNVHLFCPISGVRIPLPPVTNVSDIHATRNKDGKRCKAVMLTAPKLRDSSNDEWEFAVMMIYFGKLLFAKAGMRNWIQIATVQRPVDVMACSDIFHVMDSTLKVSRVTLDPEGNFVEPVHVSPGFWNYGVQEFHNFVTENPQFLEHDIADYGDDLDFVKFFRPFFYRYLVKSIDGKLLVVLGEGGVHQRSFKVLEWEKRKRQWKHLTSLRDQVIFVSQNNTICLRAVEFPELRPNSIYYVKCRCTHNYTQDIGEFCLEDTGGVVERTYNTSSLDCGQQKPLSVWFMPVN